MDQGVDSYGCDRFSAGVRYRIWIINVIDALERPVEGLINERNLAQPFHGGHRIPLGHDQPKGISMLEGNGLVVHRIGDDRVRVERFLQRQTSLIMEDSVDIGPRSSPVNTTSPCSGLDLGSL